MKNWKRFLPIWIACPFAGASVVLLMDSRLREMDPMWFQWLVMPLWLAVGLVYMWFIKGRVRSIVDDPGPNPVVTMLLVVIPSFVLMMLGMAVGVMLLKQ